LIQFPSKVGCSEPRTLHRISSIMSFANSFAICLKPSLTPSSVLRQSLKHPSRVFGRQHFSTQPSKLSFKNASPSSLVRSLPFQKRNASGFAIPGLNSTNKTTRFLTSAGIVAVTVLGTNWLFNRETRDSLSPAEASHLNNTFMYLGEMIRSGIGFITDHQYLDIQVEASPP
jgi:hypothetical protein